MGEVSSRACHLKRNLSRRSRWLGEERRTKTPVWDQAFTSLQESIEIYKMTDEVGSHAAPVALRLDDKPEVGMGETRRYAVHWGSPTDVP
jgi:hypothetical protein